MRGMVLVASAVLFAGCAQAAPTGMTLAQFQARMGGRLMAADTDGDGRVSLAEFTAAMKAGRGDPARRFARMDTNHDGYLDKGEIDAALVRRFAKLDRNGDGVLTPDERMAARGHGTPPGE